MNKNIVACAEISYIVLVILTYIIKELFVHITCLQLFYIFCEDRFNVYDVNKLMNSVFGVIKPQKYILFYYCFLFCVYLLCFISIINKYGSVLLDKNCK